MRADFKELPVVKFVQTRDHEGPGVELEVPPVTTSV